MGMREAVRFPVGNSFVVGLAAGEGAPQFWLSPSTGAETRELCRPSLKVQTVASLAVRMGGA
jgi:hypothetical protein